MLNQAIQLAYDIGMFQSRKGPRNSLAEGSSDMQRVTAITALGVLSLNACVPQCIRHLEKS